MSNNRKEEQARLKGLSGGKSSRDMTIDELVNVSNASRRINETQEERLARINAFRAGW